jgi:hypothetical protein
MSILEAVQEVTSLTRKSSSNGGEWSGSCPFCSAGTDRFLVWPSPSTGQPRYWCRVCNRSGDEIQFYRDYYTMSFREACDRAGQSPLLTAESEREPAPPTTVELPAPEWTRALSRYIAKAQTALRSDAGAAGMSYLQGRGFEDATIRGAGLGYTANGVRTSAALSKTLGLADDRKVWMPERSIICPWFLDGQIAKVNMRRIEAHDGRKWVEIPGSANCLYGVDELKPGVPVMIVESVLDALAVKQVARDLVSVVATGTTTGARRMRWLSLLALAPVVLVAFDNDPNGAGEDASAWWIERLGPTIARRWRPFWDDPAAMLSDPSALRAWVECGVLAKVSMINPGASQDHTQDDLRARLDADWRALQDGPQYEEPLQRFLDNLAQYERVGS